MDKDADFILMENYDTVVIYSVIDSLHFQRVIIKTLESPNSGRTFFLCVCQIECFVSEGTVLNNKLINISIVLK